MIYDTLTNSHLYYGISARLQKALDFLVNSDFSTIPVMKLMAMMFLQISHTE